MRKSTMKAARSILRRAREGCSGKDKAEPSFIRPQRNGQNKMHTAGANKQSEKPWQAITLLTLHPWNDKGGFTEPDVGGCVHTRRSSHFSVNLLCSYDFFFLALSLYKTKTRLDAPSKWRKLLYHVIYTSQVLDSMPKVNKFRRKHQRANSKLFKLEIFVNFKLGGFR